MQISWRLLLQEFGTFPPLSWKTADRDPLPQIENPFEFSDFRGINVTPVQLLLNLLMIHPFWYQPKKTSETKRLGP